MTETIKLFLTAPIHYNADPRFMSSVVNTMTQLPKRGVSVYLSAHPGESLVQRARNRIVDEFLSTDCTHLLFADADESFDPEDVVKLIECGHDLVGAFVPKKGINWERVRRMAIEGASAEEMAAKASDVVINCKGGTFGLVNGCMPVECIGTGFMMIRRAVFEKMIAAYGKDIAYSAKAEGDASKTVYAFFDAAIHQGDKRYLSEDFVFCIRAAEIGIQPYGHLGINIIHWGTYGFRGDVSSVVTVNPIAAE